MSKPTPTGGSAIILDALTPISEAVTKLSTAVEAIRLQIDTMNTAMSTNHTLDQTQFEEIKGTLDQVLKIQAGAKKQVKPAEDKEPTSTTTASTTATSTGNAKKTKETEMQFFMRMSKDDPAFKAKYDSDLIKAKCVEKNKKCKSHFVITQMNLPEYATLKADFLAAYAASQNKPAAEVKELEVKDDL